MVPGRRFTVRLQSDGHIVVEDVHTGEQSRVAGLDGIGEQIGRWLDAGDPAANQTPPATSTSRSDQA